MTDAAVDRASAQISDVRTVVPTVQAFFDQATFAASYVVWDPRTRRAAIVDSVLDYDPAAGRATTASADRIVDFIAHNGLQVDWLLETHVHADHLSGARYLKERLGGQVATGQSISEVRRVFSALFNTGTETTSEGAVFDRLLDDGDRFAIGQLETTVLHVPGHTPADVAYVIGDAAFVGDTLFMPDRGTARADFPGGNARTLYRSVRRLMSLPESTRVFVCHDYKAPGRDYFAWETTVAEQRAYNIHIHAGVDEAAFVAMRTARDARLDMPRLMLPSLQVNLGGGQLPAPEANGIRYLKIPLNAV